MRTYTIAAIPGDGIGKDVIEAGMKVIRAAEEVRGDVKLTFETFPWSCGYYLEHGHHPPVLQVVATTPGERLELDLDVAPDLFGRADDLDAGLNDILADAVAGDRRDRVRPHRGPPFTWVLVLGSG